MTENSGEVPPPAAGRDAAVVADGMTLRRHDGAMLLAVDGEIDYRRIEDFRRALAYAVISDRDVVVALHDATPLGPGSVRLLGSAARAAATHGRHLRVTGGWYGSVTPA